MRYISTNFSKKIINNPPHLLSKQWKKHDGYPMRSVAAYFSEKLKSLHNISYQLYKGNMVYTHWGP